MTIMDDIKLKKKATKLNIPTYIRHNGENFFLNSIKRQKRQALKLGKQLEKEKNHIRIKFYKNKFAVYSDKNAKKNKKILNKE